MCPLASHLPYSTLFRSRREARSPEIGVRGERDTTRRSRAEGVPLAHRCLSPRPGSCCDRTPSSAGRSVPADRESTRLNSSHMSISYDFFFLNKKKQLT